MRRRRLPASARADPAFDAWFQANVVEHRAPGYAIVNLSLKAPGIAPGDLTADQMDKVADLADRFSLGELRVSHRQNLVFPDVRQTDLHALWQELQTLSLATPNIGKLTDIIACPGLDFCALANARAIPVAQDIGRHFSDAAALQDIGELTINISGCMNACGHHHVGHIGILGVEKNGQEFYQLTLGGSSGRGRLPGRSARPEHLGGRGAGRDRSHRRRATRPCGRRTSASSTPTAESASSPSRRPSTARRPQRRRAVA